MVRPSDLLLALLAGVAVLVEALLRAPAGVSPAAYLLAVLAAGPLAFRTVAPLATLLATAAAAVLCSAVLDASWTVTATVGIALFTVALLGDRRRSLAVALVTALSVTAAVLVIEGGIDAGGLVTRLALVVMCVAAGEVLRTRAELAVARRERAERDARERQEELRRHAAAERLQMARELHDTLAHFLVAINVRASVAIDVAQSQDPTAALQDIKHASASALRDLRSTLSVLRDGDDQPPTTPAPGLDALEGLVDRARGAGIDTQLEVRADTAVVPAAIGAATVRIVQESLTNVIRHAHATRARVVVHAVGDELRIEVADDGRPSGVPAGEGFGLRGMTERASALGGELRAGPAGSGGWSVSARLPLGSGALS